MMIMPWDKVTWDHATKLVDSLAWPAVAFLVVVFLGPTLRRFLNDAKQCTLRGGGLEASATRESLTAAAAVGAAVAHRQIGNDSQSTEPREFASLVQRALSPHPRRRLSQSSILWVDDRPENNLYERRALEALGIRVDWAKDTEEALRKLARKGYDLVISDMGRPSGDRAGYDLLRRVRAGGETIPYIIYAGSNLPEDKAQAKDLGAQGNTNDPQELFELVIDHLLR